MTATIQARPADVDAGVIRDARRRQRRRQLAGLLVAVTVALLAVALVGSSGPADRPHVRPSRPSPTPAQNLSSATNLLAQEPRLGVACHVANIIKCDRVGLAVWLRRPALSVTATIAGRPVTLNDPLWSGQVNHGRRTMFAGFLQPAGMLDGPLNVRPDRGRYWWAGGHPTSARLRILAHYGRGRTALTTTTVELAAGWG